MLLSSATNTEDSPYYPHSPEEAQAILAYLLHAERALPRTKKYHGRSSHLNSHRRKLVDWLYSLANDTLKLDAITFQLSVRLMDYFMDGHFIEEPQLKLVGLCCLLLAAKFEEKDGHVPKIRTLLAHLGGLFSKNQFRDVECLVLEYFHWNVNLPVAQHFLDALLVVHDSPNTQSYRDYVTYFTDIALQDQNLVKLRPSVLAGAILYCSRRVLKLTPRWPDVLITSLRGVRVRNFTKASKALLTVFETGREEDRLAKEQKLIQMSQQRERDLAISPPREKRPRNTYTVGGSGGSSGCDSHSSTTSNESMDIEVIFMA